MAEPYMESDSTEHKQLQKIRYLLSQISWIPNRAVKPTVDLSTERNDKSLVEEGLLPGGKTFLYLTIFKKGTGFFSLKVKFGDGSSIEYSSDDLHDGYMMERRFVDIIFTNASQAGTNPVLLVEWKE